MGGVSCLVFVTVIYESYSEAICLYDENLFIMPAGNKAHTQVRDYSHKHYLKATEQ